MRNSSLSSRCLLLCALAFGGVLPAHAQAPPPSADLGITKVGPTTASAGTDVVYTLTVVNAGPDDAASANMSDQIPAGMTFVSLMQTASPAFTCTTPAVGAGGIITCNAATLATGSSATFAVTLHIPAGTAAGTLFENTASVSSETPDPNSENNSTIWGVQIPSPQADVSIIKTGPVSVAANSDISYTIVVANYGPDAATNVAWADNLPAGFPSAPMTFVSFNQTAGPAFTCTPGVSTTCTIASLAAGASATFTLIGHVPNGTSAGTIYTNVAAVTSDNDPNSENDSSATTTTVSSADVAVTKSGPASAIAGGPSISYTISLSNNGPDAATQARFTDALPAGLTFVSLVQNTGPAASCAVPAIGANGSITCTIAVLANGSSAQFTLTAAVSASVANGTTLQNTATATTDSVDPNHGNDTSTVATTVSTQADLGVTKSGPANVIAGGNATYTLTLINAGPSNAASVTLSDSLPTDATFVSLAQAPGPAFTCATPPVGGSGPVTCSIATLAVGASASFTLVITVPVSAGNGSNLVNTATASSATTDPNTANNSASATSTVNNTADLVMSKTAAAIVTAGQNLTYTLGLANQGTSPANNAQWSDTLPAGTTFVSLAQTAGPAFTCTTPTIGAGGTITCGAATLAVGASASFALVVAVAGDTAAGTTLTNTATAQTSSVDANPANNSAVANTNVGATADLSVSKTAASASVPPGSKIVYTLGVNNNGPSAASAVALVDALPSGTRFVSLAQTAGPAFACTTPAVGAGGTVTCTVATLAYGASASFALTIDTVGVQTGSVVNTASATTTTADPTSSNNSASVSVALVSAPVAAPLLHWQMLLLMTGLIAAFAWRRRRMY
ncbi:DUF11 domain-containing protein [Rudaea sp.]|uniref:DUF11 domain-containing protein n=1 Tax=Rudaea sp. TaxID=2136325 RepID=UPI002ED53457